MKPINEIVSQPASQAPARAPLTQEQADTVGYFFARVRVIYGNQYLVNFPDESTEKFAKREYARQVCDIPRERMDAGFTALHQQRQQSPGEWQYLDLDKIIGLIKTGGEHWSHRVMREKDAEWAESQKRLTLKRSPETIEKGAQIIAELRKSIKTEVL